MARPQDTTQLLACSLLGLFFMVAAHAALALSADAQSDPLEALVRDKRQASANQGLQSVRPDSRTSIGASSASASASAISSASASDVQVGSNPAAANTLDVSTRIKRPKQVPASVASVDSSRRDDLADDESFDDEERPARARKPKTRRRRPANRRTSSAARYDNDEAADGHEDYEDCQEYDYDDHHQFMLDQATRPIRHMNHMMMGMFDRMRDMAARGFDGANGAVASSTSGGDGYSRTSSLVSSNGRTRGIISETRNGRTRTRRIDSNDDEGFDDE